jgi:tellurite resistance protein TehA-like permease
VRRHAAAACAAAMGTGIVSLDLHDAGLGAPSALLLAIAAALGAGLLLSGGLSGQIAGVPAVAVVGSGLAARGDLAWPFLVAAALLLAWRLPRARLPERVTGTGLLPVVAIQSVVILAGDVQPRAGWLEVPALVGLCAGALGYTVLIGRVDRRHVTHGAGDQWIAGGAAAITALACATLARDGDGEALDVAAVAAWIAAMLWLPFLVAGELRQPRLGALGRRWATVFPLGMYAACSFTVGQVARVSGITGFARVWTWVALAATLLALAGLFLRIRGAWPQIRSRIRSRIRLRFRLG